MINSIKRKLNNKDIFNNYNLMLQGQKNQFVPISCSDISFIQDSINKNDDPKEVFHHAKSAKEYGQDIKNIITANVLLDPEKDKQSTQISDINQEIEKNDNKLKFKIIRFFGGMHDVKCAFICSFLEISCVFILATFINAKGKFEPGKLWDDVMSEFRDRVWQSWVIFALAVAIFAILAFGIPKLIKSQICKPYLNNRDILTKTRELLQTYLRANHTYLQYSDANEEFQSNSYSIGGLITDNQIKIYIALISNKSTNNELTNDTSNSNEEVNNSSINGESNQYSKVNNCKETFIQTLQSIKSSDDNQITKAERLDSFLWDGYYIDDNKELIINPIFKQLGIEINKSTTVKLEEVLGLVKSHELSGNR